MLEKLIIDNFQSHKHTELEFSSGLNIITGETNSGKTAIIRALKFGLRNESVGTDTMIRHGCDSTSIELFVDGHSVKREKGARANAYFLDSDQKESVGRAVPEDIQEFLGPSSINVANKEKDICFFGQFDGPFLITESPGFKSKLIGKLSSAEVLDEAVRITNEESGKINRSADATRRRLEDVDGQIESLEDVEECRALLDEASRWETAFNQLEEQKTKIEELQQEKIRVDRVLQRDTLLLYNGVRELEELLDTFKKASDMLTASIENNQKIKISKKKAEKLAEASLLEGLANSSTELLDRMGELERSVIDPNLVKSLIKKINKFEQYKRINPQYKVTEKIIAAEFLLEKLVEVNTLRDDFSEQTSLITARGKDITAGEKELLEIETKARQDLGKISLCQECNQPLMGVTLEGIF